MNLSYSELEWVKIGHNRPQLVTMLWMFSQSQTVFRISSNLEILTWGGTGGSRTFTSDWDEYFFLTFHKLFGGFEKGKKTLSCYDPDMTIRNFVCSTEYIQMVVTFISPKLWISLWSVYTVLFGLDLFNSIKSDEPQPSSHLRVESLKYSTARTQHEKSKQKGRHTFPSRNSWNIPGGELLQAI